MKEKKRKGKKLRENVCERKKRGKKKTQKRKENT